MSLIPKTCFFTGHRIIAAEDRPTIRERLTNAILDAVKDGVTVFIAGGAMGFDMLAAEQVLSVRNDCDIRLCLYLPCKNHNILWSEGDRLRFDSIFAMADEVYYVSRDNYSEGCMKKRNMAMTEASDMCIAYLKTQHSGTAQTVKLAEDKNLKIIHI